MILLLTALLLPAHAAKKPEIDGDVIVTVTVPGTPAQAYARVDNLDVVSKASLATTESCLTLTPTSQARTGIGAQFEARYLMEGWRRKLDVSVLEQDPGRRIDWEHHGNKGFRTRWTFKEAGDSTEVKVHTFLNAPPWPFRGYFVKKVRPAWQACVTELVEALPTAPP